MNAHEPVRASTRAQHIPLWMISAVLLALLAAWALRSGVVQEQRPANVGVAAAPSAVQSVMPSLPPPSTEPTAVPTASVPDISPVPVDPVLTEAEVTQIALDDLAKMAEGAVLLGLTPVNAELETVVATRYADLSAYEPRIGAPDPESPVETGIVWVARGKGTFLVTRGRNVEPWVGETGYLLIDDATGGIVGMGTP